MARPKSFVVDSAVDQAMQVFWVHGFRGASVRVLSQAMGIRSGSLYATFGSKDALFRLALRRYLERKAPTEPPGPDAIRAWFERVVTDRVPTGCLLVGSAFEKAELDPESQALVAGGLAALEGYFVACLKGRPGARRDAATLATTVAGLHVLHRAGVPEASLRAVAERALETIGSPPGS